MKRTSHTAVFSRPGLAVSACLLGEPVRYDGGHKRHRYLAEVLSAYVDCVPLCPEAGIGMGIPRAPIQLVGTAEQPRALGVQDPSRDFSAHLQQFAAERHAQLRSVSGYLFKRDSPSCGLRRVKLFATPGGRMQRRGTGIFAAAVTAAVPLLPVEEEDALDDPLRREPFLCRLFAYWRWQLLQQAGTPDITALRDFHRAHAHLVRAHSRAACQRLSRLLAAADAGALDATAGRYIRELLAALTRPASHDRHCAVQRELARELEPHLDAARRSALLAQLQAYRNGALPLARAVAALRDAFATCAACGNPEYTYLTPYPAGLHPWAANPAIA